MRPPSTPSFTPIGISRSKPGLLVSPAGFQCGAIASSATATPAPPIPRALEPRIIHSSAAAAPERQNTAATPTKNTFHDDFIAIPPRFKMFSLAETMSSGRLNESVHHHPPPQGHLYLLHHLPDGPPILKQISVLSNCQSYSVTKSCFHCQFYNIIWTVSTAIYIIKSSKHPATKNVASDAKQNAVFSTLSAGPVKKAGIISAWPKLSG